MSTLYSFYIGYKTVDGLFHAYGPYNKFKELMPVYKASGSFISSFFKYSEIKIDPSEMDEELKEKFVNTIEFSKDDYKDISSLYYISLDKLPDTNFVKQGYFKRENVLEYFKSGYTWELDYTDYYSVEDYSNQLITAVQTDDAIKLKELKEYVYISYVDYSSEEYISAAIQSIMINGGFSRANILQSFSNASEPGYTSIKDVVILIDID